MKLFKSKKTDQLNNDQLDAIEEFDMALEKLEKANKGPEGEEEAVEETPEAEGSEEEASEEAAPEDGAEEASAEEEEAPEPEKTNKSKAASKAEAAPEKIESLESIISEDPEADAAMAVEPFLKSFAKAVDKKLEAIRAEHAKQLGTLNKAFAQMSTFQKAQSAVLLAEGKLLKSLTATDQESLDQPQDRKSIQVQERFIKSEGGEEELSVTQARIKLGEFAKSGVLNPQQVAKIENRINHGQPLPEYFIEMLKNPETKKEEAK
jgi:hypothetical protein